MKVIKNGVPLYERLNNVHHGFMKALKMRTSFFMSLSKICITVYEGQTNAFRMMSASEICITI